MLPVRIHILFMFKHYTNYYYFQRLQNQFDDCHNITILQIFIRKKSAEFEK